MVVNKSCVAACLESVRMAVESVSGCSWNECPDQRGITVRMCVEWVSESAWNPHLEHIQPGNPQQNAYVERYNRTVRYDWLGHYLFESIAEVQEHATRWIWTYNHERPNMALGGITPKQKLALAA